jgi:hypothetical protein
MAKQKPIKKFFKEPVFWVWFDLYINVPFREMQRNYSDSHYIINLNEKPQCNGRSINEQRSWYNIIWIANWKWWLPILVHEIIHQLNFQLKYNNVWYGKNFEILAYMTEYFVREINIYLDKLKK